MRTTLAPSLPVLTGMHHGRVVSDIDHAIAAEIRAQMAVITANRIAAGDLTASYTQGELADDAQMPLSQVGRRLRGESPFSVDDLIALSTALRIEPWALLHAAIIRQRAAAGQPLERGYRDQVHRGPTGYPVIQ